MRTSLVAVALSAVSIVGFGCGGSSGGGNTGGGDTGGGFTTSVSGNASLGSLSASQQTQLCADALDYLSDTIEPAACKETAFGAAAAAAENAATTESTLEQVCTSAYEECLATAVGDAGEVSGGSCDFSSLTPASCGATVAQFSACLTDLANAEVQPANSEPSCSAITSASLASALALDAGVVTVSSANCVAFEEACPAAISSVTTTGVVRRHVAW